MTAYMLLQRVREAYGGARGSFVIARLALRTGIDLRTLKENDNDPHKAAKLREAIREICADVEV